MNKTRWIIFATGFLQSTLLLAGELILNPQTQLPFNLPSTQDPRLVTACEKSGREYGRGAIFQMDSHCFRTLLDSAPASAMKQSSDEKLFAVGSKNLIFIRQAGKSGSLEKHTISGAQAGLSEIRAVSLVPENGEVVVLDHGSSSIASFRSSLSGNVAPDRRLASVDLEQAASIAVDAAGNELYVSFPAEGKIRVYNLLANTGSINKDQTVTVLREIKGPLTQLRNPVAMSYSSENGELYVADRDSNQILVFDRKAKDNSAPVRTIAGSHTGIQGPVAVGYSAGKDEIQVITESGSALRFSRTSKGDALPVQ
ncbi:MAG: hypothetical protein H7222_12855 [Methylotenera sp.]|nr:hypothetical protein [Oligoflexia bacterium]